MGSPFPETITTERLRLEQLSHENVDIPTYYRICSSDDGIEAVTEHVPWDPHETIKETDDYVTDCEERWAAGDSADYLIRPGTGEDDTGEIAGTCGLYVDWEQRTGELGVWLRQAFWGRGYARERADALLELAFDRLDLALVIDGHFSGNEQARKSFEAHMIENGGQRDGVIRNWQPMSEEVVEDDRYSVTREEYFAAREGDRPEVTYVE